MVVLGLPLCLVLAAANPTDRVSLPGGAPGIGFDDLRYSARLDRVLAPAGRAGYIALIDPSTHAVTQLGSFASSDTFDGGHDFGVTSVDDTGTWLLATDRTRLELVVLDATTGATVAKAHLAAGPDYVRWSASTQEVWVTQPDAEQIEVFALASNGTPSHRATLHVAGGPESLTFDSTHGRAYTHLWKGATVAIDLTSRAILTTWKNGCEGSRGIALDAARGAVMVACAEGQIVVLASTGERLGEAKGGKGLDVVDFDAHLRHLYAAGQTSASLSIVGISAEGRAQVLGTTETVRGARCAVGDGHGHVWVCDPKGGALLIRDDPYP